MASNPETTTHNNDELCQFVANHNWKLVARWTAPAYVPPTSNGVD